MGVGAEETVAGTSSMGCPTFEQEEILSDQYLESSTDLEVSGGVGAGGGGIILVCSCMLSVQT